VGRLRHGPRGIAAALAFVLAALTFAVPRQARAWYFPEHIVLTGDGHAELPDELRAVVAQTITLAQAQGLRICSKSDARLDDVIQRKPIKTAMIRADSRVDCIPYAALPALAADHASTPDELRTVIGTDRGIEIVSAVAFEWLRYREAFRRDPAAIDRMSFVHELDVALYFIDSDYVARARATRSHFHDNSRPFATILRDTARAGQLDDVLSRFLFHHLRSLALAAHAKAGPARVEALLEHAFALHFLQDAFSAGHLVINDAMWAAGQDVVRARHDAFDAAGLAVTRVMGRDPCARSGASTLEIAGLPPCWTTTGDGYLGPFADSSDRRHVAAALSRAEVAFAIALDPERAVAYAEQLGESERIAFAATVDPVPWWTVDREARKTLPSSAARAMRLVRGAAAAVARLRDAPAKQPVAVDIARRPYSVEEAQLEGILDPCVAREKVTRALVADADEGGDTTAAGNEDDAGGACGPGRTLAVGTVGVSLLRPTLAQWPTPRDDVTKLRAEGHRDTGWAIQVFAGTGTTVLVPPGSAVDFFGPGLSLTAGLSYRFGSYLPGRSGRPAFEVNIGISSQLHLNSDGRAGGNPYVTMFDQELRWPVLWEILTTYTLPLDLARVHRAGYLLFFNGVRVHELLNQGAPVWLGIELEAAAIALSRGYGTHPLYAISPELRFYIGVADPSTAQPSYPATLGVTFGIAITGGYATFL